MNLIDYHAPLLFSARDAAGAVRYAYKYARAPKCPRRRPVAAPAALSARSPAGAVKTARTAGRDA